MKNGRGRPKAADNKGRSGKNQARGSRKRARGEIDTNEASLEARAVVNWLWHNCVHSMTEIARFCGLDYQVVTRWAKKTSVATAPGRGPKHVIPEEDLLELRAKAENKRFQSGDKLRGAYINPEGIPGVVGPYTG